MNYFDKVLKTGPNETLLAGVFACVAHTYTQHYNYLLFLTTFRILRFAIQIYIFTQELVTSHKYWNKSHKSSLILTTSSLVGPE